MNINRNELKNFIFSLCSTMSVSGFETRADAQLEALAKDGTIMNLAKKYGVENTVVTDFADQK